MRNRWPVAVVALLGLFTLTGCPSVSTTGMARTLNKGAMQGFVAPGTVAIEGVWLPQIEVGGRYGITDHIEFGAKAWLLGAGMDAKFSLLRAPSMQGGIDLAIDPNVSYFGVGSAAGGGAETEGFGLLTVGLPVLVGVNFSGHQLMIGPKLVGHVGFGTGGTSGGLLSNTGRLLGGGASLGIALKLGQEFRLMPEVTYVRYFWSDTGTTPVNAALIQGGLTVLFGGGYDPPAPKE